MIQRVQQSGGQGDRGPDVVAAGAEDEARAEAEDDDPDVLDRVEREQTLQVVLEERIDDAADRRQRTECQHQHADPDRQRSDPVDEDANEAVDRDLDHHAAHQRRHRRGRDRVRAGEPTVHRHQTGFGAHAHDGCERDRDLHPRALDQGAAGAESTGVGCEQHRDPGSRPGEVRDREIEEHGAPGLVVAARAEDDRRRQQRHQLPAREERQRVARAHHFGEHKHERNREQRARASAPRWFEVTPRESERGRGDEAEHAEKERRQPVDAEARRERSGEIGAERRAGRERPEAEAGQCPRGERLYAPAHSDSSSRRSDCWPASCRVRISRATARSSKACSSAMR